MYYNSTQLLFLLQAAAAVSVVSTADRESIISTTILKLHTYEQCNVKNYHETRSEPEKQRQQQLDPPT